MVRLNFTLASISFSPFTCILGQRFKPEEDKDVYVTSRLNLKLPPQIDDLIPPTTRISTKPALCTENPQWRTTLVYYVSRSFLSRLRKQHAPVTLEIFNLSEKCTKDKLGSVELHMEDAKVVVMRQGRRDMSQIQQFVVDKGEWLSLGQHNREEIKAGLFIVEMPHISDSPVGNKEVGTPLQKPMRTASRITSHPTGTELGLEIHSDMSELFINSSDETGEEEEDKDDDDDDALLRQELHKEYDEIASNHEDVISIGHGTDRFGFVFRITEAKHISTILENYSNVIDAFFYYQFLGQEYHCSVNFNLEEGEEGWQAREYHDMIRFQGNFEEVRNWLSDQSMIQVCLVIKQAHEEDIIIGYSEVYIKDKELGLVQKSRIIYDHERTWHINDRKQFAKLQYQIGLIKGWTDPDEYKSSVYDENQE